MNKNFLRKWHIFASVLFLPFVFLYALSGSLYVLGYGQNAGAKQSSVFINSIIPKDKSEKIKLLKQEALKNHFFFPSNYSIKERDGKFEVYNAKFSLILAIKDGKSKISQINRTWLGTIFMLHKDHGGKFFSFLAILFSVFLFSIYLSGFLFTSWCKQYRKQSLLGFIVGILLVFYAFMNASYF